MLLEVANSAQSCLRCLKIGRTCGGYDQTGNDKFRQYEHPTAKSVPPQYPFNSIARKCSLSPRIPIPGTGNIPEDAPPSEVPEHLIEELALRAFFHDYCVVPVNPALSRGFLAGLEPMVQRLGPQSPLADACKAVAFACHGLKLSRPFLTEKAEMLYQTLLGSLAHSIQDGATSRTPEIFIITILLGLYEVTYYAIMSFLFFFPG